MRKVKMNNSLRQCMLISIMIAVLLGGFVFQVTAQQLDNNRKIKIALLLDTSNSMDGLIEQAKSQLWQLVNELAKARFGNSTPMLEIALYEYGNDRLSAKEGYIRQVTSLTEDLDQISQDLFELTTKGGSEYCGQVIQTTLAQQDWGANSNDLQIIFIAGNEGFDQGAVNYKTACLKAKEKGVIVNTIFCGDFNEGINTFWKDGAMLTKGEYMCIEQDRKTVYIASPYDDEITTLNNALNKTYIGYGKLGRSKKQMQLQQDSNASSYDKANMVKRAISKSSHFYKNSSWDIVDALKDDSEFFEKIKEEELPQELKGKSIHEKEKFVGDLAMKRKKISLKIGELNKKRALYVAQKKKEQGSEDMLDQVMIKAIKNQAISKQFVF